MNRAVPIAAALVLALTGFSNNAYTAQQVLVIGDSLTKEYEVEFPALFPDNPPAWLARNWIELLHSNRNAHFDLGSFSVFLDPRATGHKYNWAFPGATTQEIRNRLSSTSFLDKTWQDEFKNQIKTVAERVVVFAGGNDVEDYYDDIYNGASGTPFINTTRDNLKWIVDFIKTQKSSIPVVLVSVPHVGCTPKVQQSQPTHATKTTRVSSALESLNSQLASYAQTKGIGFAPDVYTMTKALITEPFYIGGVEFYREADADSHPRYLYSGDGFHPNTCAHARIAQMVVDAFRATYASPVIAQVTDTELLQWLTVDADLGFLEWLVDFNVPLDRLGLSDDPDGDGTPNLLEFLLDGLNPNGTGTGTLPQPVLQNAGGTPMLTYTWKPNPQGVQYAPLTLMQSANLKTWTAVPTSNIVTNADGSKTASLPASTAVFLRLMATK